MNFKIAFAAFSIGKPLPLKRARVRASLSFCIVQPGSSSSSRMREARIVAANYEVKGFRDAGTGLEIRPDPETEFLLVSGIAKPDHLRNVTKKAGLKVKEELYFPDHHRLRESDKKQIRKALSGLRSGSLLVTEKDLGRWADFFAEGIRGVVICVRFSFLEGGEEELRLALEEVGKGAGCSTLA